MHIRVHFSIGSNVKQSTRGIVGTRSNSLSVGEESAKTDIILCEHAVVGLSEERAQDLLHRIDVTFVSHKGLDTFAASNIPELCCSITCSRDENVLIWGERETVLKPDSVYRLLLKKKIKNTLTS